MEIYIVKRVEDMPPYDPPDAHYAQIDCSEYDEEFMFKFVGNDGWRMKKLTSKYNLYYLYYHPDKKIMSIHGSWYALQKMPGHLIKNEINEFKNLSENA